MKVGPVKDEDSEAFKKAVEFVKKNEGIMHLTAYWDINHYSICHGVKSHRGETTNAKDCEKRLSERVKYDWDRTEGLKNNLRIALTSFFYNVGFKSDVLKYAKRNDIASVKYLMNKYIYCGGKVCRGLKTRRAGEIAMIIK